MFQVAAVKLHNRVLKGADFVGFRVLLYNVVYLSSAIGIDPLMRSLNQQLVNASPGFLLW